MDASSLSTAFRRVLRRIGRQPAGDLTDAQLLDRFAATHEENAFETLVQRHGSMVLGVCRRVLEDADDADDAFQATFLMLARKASSLDKGRSLGSWLYTVARNVALKARASAGRRRHHERHAAAMQPSQPSEVIAWQEVSTLLDAELGALPEKYRSPLVLCYLEGKSHEAAARELGWPVGSMAKRLDRARDLLRQQLIRRGISLSAAVSALGMAGQATAAPSMPLINHTGKAAAQFAAGKGLIDLAASAQAIAWAEAGLQVMKMTKLRMFAASALAACLLLTGTGVLGYHLLSAVDSQEEAAQPLGAIVEDAKIVEIRNKMAQRINLEFGIDSNTPLKDALEFLADRHNFKFVVDTGSFEAIGVQKVEEQPVQLPPMKNVKIRSVLKMLLEQIRGDLETGGYRLRPGLVEIAANARAEGDDEAPDPALLAKLARPVSVTVPASFTAKEGTELPDFLKLLQERYGVCYTATDFGFGGIRVHPIKTDKFENVKLADAIDQILARAECMDKHLAVSYIVRDDFLQIVPIPIELRQQAPLGRSELLKAWDDFNSDNRPRWLVAGHILARAPRQSVPLLKEQIQLVPADAELAKKIPQLLKDLDSDKFDVRQRATNDLEKLGEQAEPALRRRIANNPPLEVRQRAEQLLAKLDADLRRSHARQLARLLEEINTPEAKQLLRSWSGGAHEARLTREAHAALERLAK
jgi:RNA polymerase sigma factor (sigma-70 family)